MQTKKDKRKNGEISITGTLPKESIEKGREAAINYFQREIELPGFRKGKVPRERVLQEVGEKAIWKEAADAALKNELNSILKEHGVSPIMPIGAALAASEAGVDIPFEIIAVVAPTCSIENYKETTMSAVGKLPKLDEEKEKGLAINALRKQARTMAKSEGDGPLTDAEAKTLGLENAAAAELFIAEESTRAVAERETQKRRGAIAEALIQKASCEIPRVIVREEAEALLEATKKDIARQGLPWNEYLKRAGKTEQAIMDELSTPAEKRVALDLIFGEIARAEKVERDEKEEERLAHALVSQGVPHENAHSYVRATIIREKVWEILGAKSTSRAQ